MIFFLKIFYSAFIYSYITPDTINFYVIKKIYEKGDSILINIKISPYILVFKKEEKEFSGGIRIDIYSTTEDKNEYFVRFFKRFSFEKYEETRERENKIVFEKWITVQKSVDKINIEVTDLNSQKRWSFSRTFINKDFVKFGDIIFFKKNGDSVSYKKPPLSDSLYNILINFDSKEEGKGEIIFYKKNETFKNFSFDFKRGINRIFKTLNLSEFNEEILKYRVKLNSEKRKVEFEDEYLLKNLDLFSIYEWNDIVDALNIIFQRSDIEELLDVKPEERKKAWRNFWDKRDPDPVTLHNELEIKFLERFQYVMKNFSGPIKGYKTDRGRIYIRFGPPDFIEDHPLEFSSYPYQIWYYNSLRLRFIFVDKTGFGDYELINDMRELYPQY
ncbi:MAG: GWxTD domain-containing protein [candidate division WOR-3 bacterium]